MSDWRRRTEDDDAVYVRQMEGGAICSIWSLYLFTGRPDWEWRVAWSEKGREALIGSAPTLRTAIICAEAVARACSPRSLRLFVQEHGIIVTRRRLLAADAPENPFQHMSEQCWEVTLGYAEGDDEGRFFTLAFSPALRPSVGLPPDALDALRLYMPVLGLEDAGADLGGRERVLQEDTLAVLREDVLTVLQDLRAFLGEARWQELQTLATKGEW